MTWTCLYRDEALVAADKPSGLLSVPGRGEAGRDCLSARVQADVPAALIVHRLDQPTSGVIVFGVGADAQRALSMAFEQRRVAKRYEAIVQGLPADDAGEIDLPLGRWTGRAGRARSSTITGARRR